ncbi:MAG: class I SAM-dependent methyltransferase [Bacteroidetes Order II. Incertae sedis bacterium]|nr:class I SAM-dependent methyltransferase [Bacteroidetes Order II. bacterium]
MSYQIPPVFTKLQRHEMMAEFDHDERARYNFLANLNRFISTVIAPGNKIAYDNRVEPKFVQENGRTFQDRHEVQTAMSQDPMYQTWAALRRSTMEMRQQAGRSVVLRQADSLAEKAEKILGTSQNLVLKPNFQTPPYLAHVDNHLMPGSYHTEYREGDVANAANYDTGLFVTTGGMLGRLTDGGGKAIAHWVKETYPDFQPKRILDIGCGLGHNVLPIAQMYPDAEIIAIDAGAPMLRYGAARAKLLGVENVTFMQIDAENMAEFADASFDWVQTTMFLHETGGKAIHRIFGEINRVLVPGGLNLHIEQPQYTPEMSYYEQFMRDWDAYYNAEPYWGHMHDLQPEDLMEEAGVPRANFMQVGVKAINDLDEKKQDSQVKEDYGRSPIWNVFGGWKPHS